MVKRLGEEHVLEPRSKVLCGRGRVRCVSDLEQVTSSGREVGSAQERDGAGVMALRVLGPQAAREVLETAGLGGRVTAQRGRGAREEPALGEQRAEREIVSLAALRSQARSR